MITTSIMMLKSFVNIIWQSRTSILSKSETSTSKSAHRRQFAAFNKLSSSAICRLQQIAFSSNLPSSANCLLQQFVFFSDSLPPAAFRSSSAAFRSSSTALCLFQQNRFYQRAFFDFEWCWKLLLPRRIRLSKRLSNSSITSFPVSTKAVVRLLRFRVEYLSLSLSFYFSLSLIVSLFSSCNIIAGFCA